MSFEDELVRVLAARGIVVARDGTWERSPGYSGPTLVSDEQLRFMNESAERRQNDLDARLKCQWVENLEQVVQTLLREGDAAPWPFMGMFWVRLYGVLADLRSEQVAFFRFLGVDPLTHVANAGSLLELGVETARRIEGVRQSLTEDELIYVDYRRHTESHPTQSAYNVRWSKKAGAVADRHRVHALDREFSVAELDLAVRRVLAAHANEPAIAVALARKVEQPLRALVAVMRRGVGRG